MIGLQTADFITVTGAVFALEQLFECEFSRFGTNHSAAMAIRHTTVATIPTVVADYVSCILGLGDLEPLPLPRISRSSDLQQQLPLQIVPMSILSQYKIPNVSCTAEGNSVAIVGGFGPYSQGFSINDYNKFHDEGGVLDMKPFKDIELIGLFKDEATATPQFEFQYLLSIATGDNVRASFWAPNTFDNVSMGLHEFCTVIGGQNNAFRVVLFPYAFYEDAIDEDLRFYCHEQFGRASSFGTTIVAPSGNRGIGAGRCTLHSPMQAVSLWPACDAYVVAVGGTMVDPATNVWIPPFPENAPMTCLESPCVNETVNLAASNYYSALDLGVTTGGGFSSAPWEEDHPFQDKGLNLYAHFLQECNLPPVPAGQRAYPDVAAMAGFYYVGYSGQVVPLGVGTEIAAAVVAAMFTIVNDRLLLDGRPPLSFTSDLLYEVAHDCDDCFVDVLGPPNACGWTDDSCCILGYFASGGWNPLTGLGEINFEKMCAFILGHPC
eukprot:TRINITY_DN1915_c0_g2_i2.p1 TRINITY_DN1915_c0_g2~~TRINITY_DN1915_c0_g2_i2.p1  ORF type:complete len:493 (+),score=61.46 TRINITY_DN1915_c0_g2_i2:324-1802(+)